MRVATFNLHAGIDGWGRPTTVLDHAAGLGADVLILPELWRGDIHDDFETLERRLAMRGAFAALATGERAQSHGGGRTWQPLLAHLTGEHGLYFDEHRALTKAQRSRRELLDGLEHGQWGLALLTRLAIEDVRVVQLDRLPREKVRRALIVARLNDDGRSFYVAAVHGAHLSHGSYRQYHQISSIIDALDPGVPVLLGGDSNCWRPLLRVLLPGWRSLVSARTWPARTPHSQIDHLLVRGPWRRWAASPATVAATTGLWSPTCASADVGSVQRDRIVDDDQRLAVVGAREELVKSVRCVLKSLDEVFTVSQLAAEDHRGQFPLHLGVTLGVVEDDEALHSGSACDHHSSCWRDLGVVQ